MKKQLTFHNFPTHLSHSHTLNAPTLTFLTFSKFLTEIDKFKHKFNKFSTEIEQVFDRNLTNF